MRFELSFPVILYVRESAHLNELHERMWKMHTSIIFIKRLFLSYPFVEYTDFSRATVRR